MKPPITLAPDGAQSASTESRVVLHPRPDRASVDSDEPAVEYRAADEPGTAHQRTTLGLVGTAPRKLLPPVGTASQRATGTPLRREYTSHSRRKRRAPLARENSPTLEIARYVLGGCAYHQERDLTAHTSQLGNPPQKGQ
jgi:hypothetical protein